MTPLLLIGGLLLFGLAAGGRAKAQEPEKKPTPRKVIARAPKTRISVRKPAKRRRVARAKAVQVTEKKKRIKKLAAVAKSARARKALTQLLKAARSRALPKTVRKAAKKKVAKIVAKPAKVRSADVKKLPTPAKVALAGAVAKSEKVKTTPDQAAKILQIWTKGGGNQGTKNNRSATVKRCQDLMGLTADGIIGPNTRKRAKELGYVLAPRSAQKPGAVGYERLLQFRAA